MQKFKVNSQSIFSGRLSTEPGLADSPLVTFLHTFGKNFGGYIAQFLAVGIQAMESKGNQSADVRHRKSSTALIHGPTPQGRRYNPFRPAFRCQHYRQNVTLADEQAHP